MLVIDAHNHAAWLGHTVQQHVANMDKYGIAMTWLLTWEAPDIEVSRSYKGTPGVPGPFPLADALVGRKEFPGRFILGYCPDPREPGALDLLEQAIELHGVQTCGEWKLRMRFDDPANLRLWRFCAERKLPITMHLAYLQPTKPDYYWYGESMESLEASMQAVPDALIIGHGNGFWAAISGDGKHLTEHRPEGPIVPGGAVIRMMRQYPNLYADLSALSGLNALTRDRAFACEFLIEFQDRLLYGRDRFDNGCRENLDSFDLPAEAYAKILSGNALRLAPPQT